MIPRTGPKFVRRNHSPQQNAGLCSGSAQPEHGAGCWLQFGLAVKQIIKRVAGGAAAGFCRPSKGLQRLFARKAQGGGNLYEVRWVRDLLAHGRFDPLYYR